MEKDFSRPLVGHSCCLYPDHGTTMNPAKLNPVGVGVIGLGFMGATHVAAYQSAAAAGYPCRLVAVCDPKQSRRKGQLWDVGGNAVSDTSAQKLAFDPTVVRA